MLRVGFGQGVVEGCDRGVFSGVLPALDLNGRAILPSGSLLDRVSGDLPGTAGSYTTSPILESAMLPSRGPDPVGPRSYIAGMALPLVLR